MILPNIWGGGQIFAFSGMDGETGWPASLVAVTLEERLGLDFYSGQRPRLWLALEAGGRFADGTRAAPFAALKPVVVASDVIVVEAQAAPRRGCRLRLVCAERAGMLGESAVLSPGVRAYLVLDLSPPASDTDQGAAGEVVVAAEGWPARPKWLAPGQRAFELRTPRARFAALLEVSGQGAQEALGVLLRGDIEELCRARTQFFERVARLRGANQEHQRTLAKAYSVLKVNVESAQGQIPLRYGVPDRAPHRWMWLWDSAFHAFGYAHVDRSLARETLLAALSKVRDDGFLPHRMTPQPGGDSQITQPPLLGWAAWSLHQLEPDRDFLARAYAPLRKYLRWDLENRDRDGDGLLEWATPDESGMDNSPRFDAGVDFAAVDFNAFAAAEAEALACIAETLGEPGEATWWRAQRQRLAEKIEAFLWCEPDGIYYDRRPDGEVVRVKTCASFAPLFAGVASPQRAQRLVQHLTDPTRFWPAFPLPSVALDEATFSDDMWRGPTWLNYDFLLIQGLRRYGYDEIAAQLAGRCLDQVAAWYQREGSIFEYYDPLGRLSPRQLHRKGRLPRHRSGGIPVITDYNWSAAVFVALAHERWGT